jgi:hypothetical protein
MKNLKNRFCMLLLALALSSVSAWAATCSLAAQSVVNLGAFGLPIIKTSAWTCSDGHSYVTSSIWDGSQWYVINDTQF